MDPDLPANKKSLAWKVTVAIKKPKWDAKQLNRLVYLSLGKWTRRLGLDPVQIPIILEGESERASLASLSLPWSNH